jgi:hypothetical protein
MNKLFPRSAFSKRCYELIHSKITQYPLELRHTTDAGWGLYSTRDIGYLEEILHEDPTLDFDAGCQGDWGFDELFLIAARGTKFSAICHDSHFGVACMVYNALPELPVKPSESINWKGISWMVDTTGKPYSTLGHEDMCIRADIVSRMFNLSDTWWNVDEYALLESKWKTNVIGSQFYLVASKFNHSCRANLGWHPLNIKTSIVATRHIKKGEQLFYDYNSQVLPRDERRFHLRKIFGFDCNCELCQSGQ